MKPEDIRVEMVVEVINPPKGSKNWFVGQTFLVKGIVYQEGRWFILREPCVDNSFSKGISIDAIEPAKSEIDKVLAEIKKETSA